MTFLPIVSRELGVASRRAGTYWVRCGAALAVLVIGTWFFLMQSGEAPDKLGIVLFGILTGSTVLYCLLAGVWFTADCLSEEKREGTLGLLFLTDLKGYDVVIGKLVASSVNGFYGVLAVLPILALPLLLGGVTAGEFQRMALVAVNTLFFSLTLGMWVSAISRSPRKAMGVTLLVILFVTAILPACGFWRAIATNRQMASWWLLPSAGHSYYFAFDDTYKSGAREFWWSAGVIHALGWLFILMACVIVPRVWQERPGSAHVLRWRELWHRWSFGGVTERVGFRSRLLDQSPYFWLSARARLKPGYVWMVLGVVACVWVWGVAKWHRNWLNEGTYILTGLLLNMLIKVWFGLEAGRQLAEDRRQGALELLLSTPLTIREILRGQQLALRRQFQGPVIVVLVASFLLMMAAFSDALFKEASESLGYWAWWWAAGMAMLVADLVAMYWVGMWRALTARNPTRAALGNLGRILVLPWVVLFLGALASVLLLSHTGVDITPKVLLGSWVVVGVAADIGFGSWAKHKLLTEFRVAATQRYEQRPRAWRQPSNQTTEASAMPLEEGKVGDSK
jgi:ABC-type transport system involved in multi-copper enzyme maturation permease subunit